MAPAPWIVYFDDHFPTRSFPLLHMRPVYVTSSPKIYLSSRFMAPLKDIQGWLLPRFHSSQLQYVYIYRFGHIYIYRYIWPAVAQNVRSTKRLVTHVSGVKQTKLCDPCFLKDT